MKKKGKDNYILLIIICFLLISIVGLLFLKNNDEVEEEHEIIDLKNHSRFYTIENSINKFYSYLSIKDSDNILKILNEDYVNEKGISIDNLYAYVDDISDNYIFSCKKIKYEELDNNVFKYYVYGTIYKDEMDIINPIEIDKYYIVNFYLDDKVFDIIPYDGGIFNEDK